MRAKEQVRSESAGGLKVKALGWTPSGLGLSPSWCSNFSLLKIFALRENYLFNTKTQIGNDQRVTVLFIIEVILDIHGHGFGIFILVSKIDENVDLLLSMKSIFELEGIINSRESCFSFCNRSIPFPPKRTGYIKIKRTNIY